MKKSAVLAGTAVLAIALLIGSGEQTNAQGKTAAQNCNTSRMIDANGDGVCDNFVDANGDGINDNQGQNCTGKGQGKGQGRHARLIDANGDGVCDNFVDANGDGINDNRSQNCTGKGQGRHARLIDANGDGVCDNFVDANGDGINDNRGQNCTGKGQGKDGKKHNGMNCNGTCDSTGQGQGRGRNVQNSQGNLDLRVFPNPADQSAKIQMNLTEKSNVTVDLYDVNGNKVNSIFNGEMESGKQTIDYPFQNIKQGNYYIRTTVNGKSDSEMIVIGK